MPDLAGLLMRSSIGALTTGDQCDECRRTPLAGERMHRLDSGPALCELCYAALPEERQLAVRSERVHASERPIAAVPKAA
jgi:hypothetical protein